MGLKGYRLWAMGQLDSTCRAPPQARGGRRGRRRRRTQRSTRGAAPSPPRRRRRRHRRRRRRRAFYRSWRSPPAAWESSAAPRGARPPARRPRRGLPRICQTDSHWLAVAVRERPPLSRVGTPGCQTGYMDSWTSVVTWTAVSVLTAK
jgi:hypothetical protein